MTLINPVTFDENAPKVIKALAEETKTLAITSYGMAAYDAEQLSIDLALKISEVWGGAQVYTPTKLDKDIFADHAPEIIKDLAARAKAVAMDGYEMDENSAEKLGVDIALKIGDEWGGEQIYIPSSIALKISQRDMQMFAEFNGYNQAALAKKYHCSVVWVYQVIKRARKQLQDKQQPQLPL